MPRTVLVAGGTRGIGLEIGKRFAANGDRVVLTQRWGSVSDAEIVAEFDAIDAKRPTVIEADVARDEDTARLLDAIDTPIDVFIPNVCAAGRGTGEFHARTPKVWHASCTDAEIRRCDAIEIRPRADSHRGDVV